MFKNKYIKYKTKYLQLKQHGRGKRRIKPSIKPRIIEDKCTSRTITTNEKCQQNYNILKTVLGIKDKKEYEVTITVKKKPITLTLVDILYYIYANKRNITIGGINEYLLTTLKCQGCDIYKKSGLEVPEYKKQAEEGKPLVEEIVKNTITLFTDKGLIEKQDVKIIVKGKTLEDYARQFI